MASVETALQDTPSMALPGLGRALVSAGKLGQKAAEDLYRKAQSGRTSFIAELTGSGAVSASDLAHTMSVAFAAPLLDLDAIDVEDQALGHDRDRIGDLVHIDADGGRVVRGIVLEADAAQTELGRAAAEGRFDLQVGRGVLKLVDVGDALLRQAFTAEDAEGDAHVLGRLAP